MASLYLHRLCLLPPQPLKLSQPFLHPNIRHHHHHHHHHRLSPPLSKPLKAIAPISASNTSPPATDRLISAASYFFPLLNGVHYGVFLMAKYPIISVPLKPVFPLLSLYHSVPSAYLISFLALYLGVVRNPIFSRYVRFNSLQALVLNVLLVVPLLRVGFLSLVRVSMPDVVLAVPLLLHRIFSPGEIGLEMKMLWIYNLLFVVVVACFLYGLVSTVRGNTPYLPFVAEATGRLLDKGNCWFMVFFFFLFFLSAI